jgi:hypothetical protein
MARIRQIYADFGLIGTQITQIKQICADLFAGAHLGSLRSRLRSGCFSCRSMNRNADGADKADLRGFLSLTLRARFAREVFLQRVEGVKELKGVYACFVCSEL